MLIISAELDLWPLKCKVCVHPTYLLIVFLFVLIAYIILFIVVGNEIKRIDPSALALKARLRHLYLHDNQLTSDSFQPSAFDGLSGLEEMTLSDNKISKLPPLPSSAEIVSYLSYNNVLPNVNQLKQFKIIV